MSSEFTVCALFFGPHADLAERLLTSLSGLVVPANTQFRLGLNRVSTETALEVVAFKNRTTSRGASVLTYQGKPPYWKYPLMRRMFHESPITTPYVMWFDDDSWIDPAAPPDLFVRIAHTMQTHDIIGAPYVMTLRGGQRAWVEDQPWYTGQHIQHTVSFITGGWFTIKTEILMKHDWPPACFEHNGGDVMLGAMCQQQRYKMGRFTHGLHINARPGGTCSSAPRRGASQDPIGFDYRRPTKSEAFYRILDGR